MTIDAPRAVRPVPQSARIVMMSEIRRAFRRGGIRRGVLGAMLLGIACGIGAMSIFRYFQESSGVASSSADSLAINLPVEMTAGTIGLCLAIIFTNYVAKDAPSGLLSTALTLVPRRSRLNTARWAALAVIGFGASFVSTTITAFAASAVNPPFVNAIGLGLRGAVVSAIATATLASIVFFAAFIAGRPVPAILMIIGLLVLLPLALATMQAVLPSGLSAVVGTLVEFSPTPLFFQSIATSTVASLGYERLVLAQFCLLVWALAAVFISVVIFRRRDI
jgi:ABC-type transport system involved in multi-copper enzyme maturation permease subunit